MVSSWAFLWAFLWASPCPYTRPELRFLQDYDGAARATGPEVTSLSHEPGVSMVSDPLTDDWYGWTSKRYQSHADCLSELRNVLHNRTGLSGLGWPHRSLRPVQDHMVRGRVARRNGGRGGSSERGVRGI